MRETIAAVLIGVVATGVMDLWGHLRRRLFGTALPNYAFVGRWLAHAARGQFRHESIARATPVRHERELGWTAHYLIGIAFASILVGAWGSGWLSQPTLAPALVIGVGTVLAPFLLMQPGMGAGVAARHTPDPNAARLQSLVTHAVFGLGLYVGAWVVRLCAY